ncbi:hypothetical protein RBU60_08445 [Mesonia sp. MT50]|uniref:Macroglobulin domain-containing protein n=1 Tax=Mesonia profundi TaxID=3070998 RepID=A0ABU1A2X6_9FLAO|nr:hypothetical protein [Mesonia profundi]MDQ7917601.1 hypothetical protein [Mesonia profundi]
MKILFQKIVFLVIFSCFALTIKGQDLKSKIDQVNEKVYISTNNQTVLTGESLRYTFFNLTENFERYSSISKIGYIELVSPSGELLKKQVINLENGLGSGSIYIPTNTLTGNYKLLGYTRWMLNRPISYSFQANIYIINPFQTPKQALISKEKDSLNPIKVQSKPVSSQFLFAKLSKETYTKREKIQIDLSALEEANLSVSVKKLDNLDITNNMNPIHFTEQNFPKTTNNSTTILPELRGQIIAGRISGDLVSNKFVALSIPGGKNSQTKIVSTNNKGEFLFNLAPFPASKKAYIEVLEENRNVYRISLDSAEINYKKLDFENTPLLHSYMKSDIEQRSIALQIQNAYFDDKKDSILANPDTKIFYEPLKKVYKLDDYKRFPTIAETIIEIANEIYFTQKNDTYKIYLRDRENFTTTEVYGSSLVLFNGTIVQNLNRLFELPAKNIERIEFVNKGYVFGPRIFNGVVNFINEDYDYELETDKDYRVKANLNRPDAIRLPNEPNYQEAVKLNKIPDYRYQLYWKPALQMEKETKNLSFFTSDVSGVFEIKIEGFTKSGKPVLIRKYFEVTN